MSHILTRSLLNNAMITIVMNGLNKVPGSSYFPGVNTIYKTELTDNHGHIDRTKLVHHIYDCSPRITITRKKRGSHISRVYYNDMNEFFSCYISTTQETSNPLVNDILRLLDKEFQYTDTSGLLLRPKEINMYSSSTGTVDLRVRFFRSPGDTEKHPMKSLTAHNDDFVSLDDKSILIKDYIIFRK